MAQRHSAPAKQESAGDKSRDSPKNLVRGFRVQFNGWLHLLRESVRVGPVNRFALGALGVAAAAAVALTLFENIIVGLIATTFVLIMMILLLFFSWLSKLSAALYRPIAATFGWLLLCLLCVIFGLLIATIAFGWPEPLRRMILSR